MACLQLVNPIELVLILLEFEILHLFTVNFIQIYKYFKHFMTSGNAINENEMKRLMNETLLRQV